MSQTNIELNRSDCDPSHAIRDVSGDEHCSLEEVDVGSDSQHAEAETAGSTELPESDSKDDGGNFSETDEENLSEEQRNENTPNQPAI